MKPAVAKGETPQVGGGLRTGSGLHLWGPDFPIHGIFQIDGSVHMDEVPLVGFLKCFLVVLEGGMVTN